MTAVAPAMSSARLPTAQLSGATSIVASARMPKVPGSRGVSLASAPLREVPSCVSLRSGPSRSLDWSPSAPSHSASGAHSLGAKQLQKPPAPVIPPPSLSAPEPTSGSGGPVAGSAASAPPFSRTWADLKRASPRALEI
jgi:hypothetical protein